MGNSPSIEDHAFQLKHTASQLAKQSKKCEASAARAKLMCKAAMEKNQMEVARVHAETAIQEKNQALNYLRLSARLTAIHHRVQNAIRMKTVTKSMSGIVKSMDEIMSSTLDIEKMSNIMDRFEKQFEDLDIGIKGMESQMHSSLAVSTPENEVDSLLSQVADEHGLEFESQMDGLGVVRPKQKTNVQESSAKDEVVLGANNNRKKGDDEDPKNPGNNPPPPPSSGSGGGAAASGGGARASSNSDADLEARLRKLQGL